MAPASIIPIEKGDRVLDICAAPGGKSTQVGARLQNSGVLFTNDISASRAQALVKNIELFGIKNAVITNETPANLAERLPGYFDKILIDAPCSGEGMFRKDPAVARKWGDKMIQFCLSQQKDILEKAAVMLREGGEILYSTCTFDIGENEGAVNYFLDTHDDFELLPIAHMPYGFAEGYTDGMREALKGCARLFPHRIKGEGHFLARLRKKGSPAACFLAEEKGVDVTKIEEFMDFCQEALCVSFDGIFKRVKDSLYLLPKGVPDLKGLHVMKSGWYLGEIRKKRFEPTQALAMGISKAEAKKTVDLPLGDERVLRYLKGETIEADGEDGWNLVLVDSYPLGWGKLSGGRLKNKYHPGWRWM